MSSVQATTDAERTVAVLGGDLLAQLELEARSRSHIQSVETHLRVLLVPFFGDRPIDRIGQEHATRQFMRHRATGLAPKTVRNVASTLHSLFALAIRRRWIRENPCSLVDLPATSSAADIRYLTACVSSAAGARRTGTRALASGRKRAREA